uniref:Uncharacterized protein n=1 Tax=Plectus sambesii TaxID=2011161 RepID=A0A914V2H9_9BILA
MEDRRDLVTSSGGASISTFTSGNARLSHGQAGVDFTQAPYPFASYNAGGEFADPYHLNLHAQQ